MTNEPGDRFPSGPLFPDGVRELAQDALAMSPADRRFGETLVREGALTREQLADAVAGQQALRGQGVTMRLGEVLVAKNLLTPEQVKQFLHLVDKQLLHCGKCGKNFNVKNWRPGAEVFCPHCSIALVAPPTDRTIDAHATRIVPPGGMVGEHAGEGKAFGRYRLLKKLGQGGMGVVWKAWDTQLKRVVALKQILVKGEEDREQVERFMREAQLAAKLRHPHIIAVFDVGVHEGQHYFTSEYVAGQSLEEAMKGKVSPKQVLSWVKDVAEALAYAHEQGVVHRDVKPANVLVDGHQKPFVMDFGLAKEVDLTTKEGSRKATLTAAGAVMGTPMYMSPEQAAGQTAKLGPASDQFSLGVMLYQMLTKRLPFAGRSLGELFIAIMYSDPKPPSQGNMRIHRDLETICLKALEKNPAKRYATMAKLATDLGRYLDGEPIVARPVSRAERAWRKAVKHRWIVIPSAAALLLAVAGTSMWVFGTIAHARDVADERAAMEAAFAETDWQKAKDSAGRLLLLVPGDARAMRVQMESARILAAATRELEAEKSRAEERDRLSAAALEAERIAEEVQGLDNKYLYSTSLPMEEYWKGIDIALADFAKLVEERPDVPELWYLRGRIYLMLTHYQKAELDLTKALELDPKHYLARLYRARLYSEWQDPPGMLGGVPVDTGKRPSEELRKRGVEDVDALKGLQPFSRHMEEEQRTLQLVDAGRLLAEGKPDEALRMLGDAQAAHAHEEYLHLMGIAHMSKGEYEASTLDQKKALERRPRYWRAYFDMALARTSAGDRASAIVDYTEALKINPRFAEAYYNRGTERARERDLDGAAVDYSEALKIDPGNVCYLVWRAWVRGLRHDLDGSIADCDEVLKTYPSLAAALYQRGSALSEKGDLEGAISSYDEALKVNPSDAIAFESRGKVRQKKGDLEGAIADYDQALRSDPQSAETYYDRGLARGTKGDLRGAIEDLTKALDIAPTDWPKEEEVESALRTAREKCGK